MEEEKRPLLPPMPGKAKGELSPASPTRYDQWPMPALMRMHSQEEEDIDKSGTSIISGAGSDAMTYDAMMQLSVPRNLFRHEKARPVAIWLLTSLVLFLTNQLTTLPVGFYPTYAAKTMHMGPTELSIFFAAYPLCIMLSSPLAAVVSPTVGRQTLICLGLMVSGSSTIAFAYIGSSSSAFVLRVLQGLGSGAAVVGSFSMVTEEFSANIGQVLAILEFIVAAAFVSAPPLGSYLYDLQGFEMPFLASGVAQLVVVIIVPFIFIEYSLPDGLYSQTLRRSLSRRPSMPAFVSFRDVLTPTCRVCLAVTTFAMASFGFIDPYLGTHMQKVLGAQHVAIGLGFALSAFVYFLGGLVYTWLSRNCGCKQVILLGLLLLAAGFFFLGPPPFLNGLFRDPSSMWAAQYLSLVFTGCGSALAIAPGLPLTLTSVGDKGMPAFNLVIGLFAAAIYLGQALGPFLSLLFMQILPTTHTPNCFVSAEHADNMITSCETSLPWAFTTYAFLALALFGFVAWFLPTGEATVGMLRKHRKLVPIVRQPSEYGQFVFFDDEDDEYA